MIRLLTEADVPAAIALLARVELASGAANIQRYLRWQPDGCWGWVVDGVLAGMVVVLRYEHIGFVGCMAVEPERQGRGLGRRLLEHAHLASRHGGVTTFLLEATTHGEPLYASLGYVVEYDTVIVARTGLAACDAKPLVHERAAIVALDREATGSERSPMIPRLVDEFAGVSVRTNERLVGYGLVVGERLGPVIARDPGAGRTIVDQLSPACTTATVAVANEAAMTAVLANGFSVVRSLHRMRLGPAVASHVAWIWALASAGAG